MKTYIVIILSIHVILLMVALTQYKKRPKSFEFLLILSLLGATYLALAGQIYYAYFYK